jgi:16S rRNA (cytidine1402-2'-O)-methyltransferase
MNHTGILYIVATPIGHLGDMTSRAIDTLQKVDEIAAEDTRHSKPLLEHFGIKTRLMAYHDHNETVQASRLIELLKQGKDIALISDAGTPLISDPGYKVVAKAHQEGIRVVPIPGSSAVISALSAAGLPSDSFYFAGFLPAKVVAREKALQALSRLSATLIFYESPHRIIESLESMFTILGPRQAVMARELTKTFETIKKMDIGELLSWVKSDANQQKGEFVILIEGSSEKEVFDISPEAEKILQILLEELPVNQAAKLAAKITGIKKNTLYEAALGFRDKMFNQVN